jgi:hypothetical protein
MSSIRVVYPNKTGIGAQVHSSPILPDGEWGNGVPSANTPVQLRMHYFDSQYLVPTEGATPGTLDMLSAILDPDTSLPCVFVGVDDTAWKTHTAAKCGANWQDIQGD